MVARPTVTCVMILALLAPGSGCGNDATHACARWCESQAECPGRTGSDGCYVTVCDGILDDDPCLDELADYYDCMSALADTCSTDPMRIAACEDLAKTCD